MCISYAQDPCEFAETLVAFVATNNSGADLTVAILDEFERKELSNSKTNAHKTPKTQRNIERMEYDDGSDGEGDDVMGAYICTTPKVRIFLLKFFYLFILIDNFSTISDEKATESNARYFYASECIDDPGHN